jgi:hypothetical protein
MIDIINTQGERFKMYQIDRKNKKVLLVEKRRFADLGISERHDLQEWIVDEPDMLGEKLLIIQKEFDGFSDTNERLDLLALDTYGNLVVIENKLDDSGRDVTWQALKYVSYCASLKKSKIIEIYQKYLGVSDSAEAKLQEFFEIDDLEELKLNPQDGDQRLILVAANFRKEVTSTVLWLLDHGIDIKCICVTPYEHEGNVYLETKQILPVQDIAEHQIGILERKREAVAESKGEATRHKLRKAFWAAALPIVEKNVAIFKNKTATKDNRCSGLSGIGGVSFDLLVLKEKVQIAVYIDMGDKALNKNVFSALYANKDEYEKTFGEVMDWRELPDNT